MNKIKKYDELSTDINNKDLESEIEKLKGEYQIEEILDIFTDPKDIPVVEGAAVINGDINKDVKRGDIIWITALIRKQGQSSTSPATTATIKVRVVDIYNGLSMLNRILK